MKKTGRIISVLMVSLLIAGCATLGGDMAYSNRGFEEICQDNCAKAEEYLKKALEINPNNPYALLNLGVVYQRTGRPELARQMYQKVIDLDAKESAQRSNEDWARGKSLADIAKKNLETL